MSLSNRELFLQHVALPSDGHEALEIVEAKGIWLTSSGGKKYIDLVSGVSVSNLGHGHPKVIEAVKKQAGRYMHLMVYGKYIQSPQVELARLMAEHLPENLQMTFFVNSGSEAVEGALKLAKRYTGRTGLVAFKNAYHGSTHGALSVLGNEEMKYAYRPLLPDIRHLRFGRLEDLQQITEKTAGVIAEPVQAEAGIIIPGKEYIQALRQRCTETGALLIFDEVQMGFGRTGKLFAFEHFDVVPDILCLAKAMGAGMPIGAFVSSGEIMETLTHHPALGHITTFGGHPVSAAAALAGLQVLLDEKLPGKTDAKGKLFVRLLSPHPLIKGIRQIGLMLGVELQTSEQITQLLKVFLEEGIVVDRFLFNDASFRIAPPLTITEEEIRMVSEKIMHCLEKLKDEEN
ncbi:MAG TPA: aspartate aminotransferase family protein [Bacteroidetes bacterium]|nr:aspartate aminotransferase family protein [Bacteroidota bacterium]